MADKNVLFWGKPKKIMSEEERRSRFSSDTEIPGTYFRNMSDEDRGRWKAKLVGHKTNPPHPQVEIRKDDAVIVVSLGGGYKYKHYTPSETRGINIHIASAGPIRWTWKELADLQEAIREAREMLERFKK